MSVVTPDQVIEALRPVQDPELHRSIVDLNMVRDVSINDGVVALTVTLTIAGCPLRNEIQNRVNGAIRPLPGVRDVQRARAAHQPKGTHRVAQSLSLSPVQRPDHC